MSFLKSAGRVSGQAAAYVVHGTRLGATQYAQGAREGYAAKASQLQLVRQRLLAEAAAAPVEVEVVEPVVTRQRKVATAAR
jgi:hypothetical protein